MSRSTELTPPRTSSAGPNCNTRTRPRRWRRQARREDRQVAGDEFPRVRVHCAPRMKDAAVARHHGRHREAAHRARSRAACAHLLALAPVGVQRGDHRRQPRREFRGRHHVSFDAVADHFARAANVREDDRPSHGHGLQRGVGKGLHRRRRQHEHIQRREHRPHVLDCADEVHAVGDFQLRGLALECSSSGPSPAITRCASTRATRRLRSMVSNTAWFFSGRHMPTVPMQQRLGLHSQRGAQPLAGLERAA